MRDNSVKLCLLHSWCWFYKSLHTRQGGTHAQTFQIVSKGFQFPFSVLLFSIAFPVMAKALPICFLVMSLEGLVAQESSWDPVLISHWF